VLFGQEINPESYAICKSDMLIKGQEVNNIKYGNSFTVDGLETERFNYMLSNPPFGVNWKKAKKTIKNESDDQGFSGRVVASFPRNNDRSLLFLQHMISKMNPDGSRIGIVFNGSPLFTGAAGSGESNIRQWIIENDWLEAIVALPDQLFYNTGISTYFWVLTNRKDRAHEGKAKLIDAREHWTKMRRSPGAKRKQISAEQITELTRLYADALGELEDLEHPLHGEVKACRNEAYGYERITEEVP